MEQKYLGTVVSTAETPTPTDFQFVAANSAIKKSQFIELAIGNSRAVGVISDVIRANRYFQRADSVQQFDKTGVNIHERFPVGEWEYSLGVCKVLGVYEDSLLKRPTLPPAPGTKVFPAEESMLHKFLGLDDNGLNIGSLEHHDLAAKINLTKLFQKHVAILAQSGSGKSYLTSVLLEELLDRKKEQGRVAVVLIDVHGEYAGFGADKAYAKNTRIYKGRDIRIPVPSVSAGEFCEFMPRVSATQKRELSRILQDMNYDAREKGPYGLDDLSARVEADESMKEATRNALAAWLRDLDDSALFSKVGAPSAEQLATAGNLSIIDLADVHELRKKQIIVTHVCRELLKARRRGKIAPFVFVLEEAHNFAKEGATRDQALSRGIIETIAREGRKFGASLCLITQRPIQLSTTALSQCNTNIILRVTNPYDLKHIGESCEGIDSHSLDSITTLRVGEALLLGEAVNYPVFVKVRKRKSQELKLGMDMEKMAREFEGQAESKSKDAEAFM